MGRIRCDDSLNEQNFYMEARLISENTSIDVPVVMQQWIGSELLFSIVVKDPILIYNDTPVDAPFGFM